VSGEGVDDCTLVGGWVSLLIQVVLAGGNGVPEEVTTLRTCVSSSGSLIGSLAEGEGAPALVVDVGIGTMRLNKVARNSMACCVDEST